MITSSNYMSTLIQKLLATWPTGAVRLVSALKKAGYSQTLLNRYRYSGWLTSVGDGALVKSGDEPTLMGALFALQHDLKLSVHVGGLSALEIRGHAHYVRTGRRRTWLFGESKRLPRWFTAYNWKSDIQYRTGRLFRNSVEEGLKNFDEGKITVRISDDVRAMFEFLSLVPKEHSIEEGKDLMSGLTSIHPVRVNVLLKACTSIKVKRLFLLLAEECGHSWMKRVVVEGLDLGTGPRNLTPGGKLHKKYKVTVPASILSGENR